jgi:hypothetical protein
MKILTGILLVIVIFSCSEKGASIDLATDVVGQYEGIIFDELDTVLVTDALVNITKISNDEIKIESTSNPSLIPTFEVKIIKNANIITSVSNGAQVILSINLNANPFFLGFDYFDSGNSFTGFKK